MFRRLLPLLLVLLLLVGGQTVSAQQESRLSAVAQTLVRYLPTAAELPPGVQIGTGPIEGTNEDIAASDPDAAELIYRFRRFTEAFELLSRADGPGNIVASAALFESADGAWGDAQATNLGDLAEVERTEPGPPVGERSLLLHFTQGIAPNQIEGYILVFQRDRLELAVSVVGPAGQVSVDEILPIARAMDARVIASPPGAVTDEQRALLEEPTPAVLVRGAVRLLLTEFYQPVEVDALLAEAWQGASRALERAGVTDVPPPPGYSSDENEAIALHMRSFPELERLAQDRLTPQELAYAALAELVDRRDDCHTSHLDRTRWEIFKSRQEGGEAVQIGVGFSMEQPMRVVTVLPNSPAERAGLRFGQEVLAINGRELQEFSVTEARALIDPREGVATTFRVRNPSGRVEEITVAPAAFALPPLESRILDGNIGYMTFYQFQSSDQQLELMRQTLEEWESQGVVGWIIDLRRNSGGAASLMNAMMSLFVSGGRLYANVERGEEPRFTSATPGLTLPFQRPLVFLVGPGSASASEIMAGSLRERGRAVLVGDTTAGCIGSFIPRGLLDGSAFNPTVSEILIGPDGLHLHRVGVTPNVPAPITPEDAEAGRDPGLPAAVAVIQELTGTRTPVARQPVTPAQQPKAKVVEF